MREVLDHGYVRLVETWGSDERIIEAARMSTQKGFEGWGTGRCKNCGQTPEMCSEKGLAGDQCPDGSDHTFDRGDEKLLRYLWEHKHATPFEMAGAIFEVQAPIFVFREWHRHRTQSFNEASARYAPLPDLNYVPQVARLLQSGGTNKQAGGTGTELTADTAREVQHAIKTAYDVAEQTYQLALARGTPKELARLVLPVGRYSRMRASANLRNWLGFLTLRLDKAAQWEIREYASAVHGLLVPVFPRTLGLFDEQRVA